MLAFNVVLARSRRKGPTFVPGIADGRIIHEADPT